MESRPRSRTHRGKVVRTRQHTSGAAKDVPGLDTATGLEWDGQGGAGYWHAEALHRGEMVSRTSGNPYQDLLIHTDDWLAS